MNYSFSLALPDEIELNPKAIEYLERGVTDFGGMLSVAKMIQNARNGVGNFILIKYATILRGAIYLTFTQQETGKVMTSVSLGGDHFDEWHKELKDFYYKLAQDNKCDEFNFLGRRGFKRYFPELTEAATLLRVRIT